MVVVPLSVPTCDSAARSGGPASETDSESMNWIGFAAGGSLVAAGLLFLVGERRAGLVAAAAGGALALLDQPETVHSWWNALPVYIDQVQRVLGQVQDTVNEVATKREDLRRVLAR